MVVLRGVQGKILSTLWILERNYANLDGMPQKCIEMLQNRYKIDFPPDGVVSWGGTRSQLGGEITPERPGGTGDVPGSIRYDAKTFSGTSPVPPGRSGVIFGYIARYQIC